MISPCDKFQELQERLKNLLGCGRFAVPPSGSKRWTSPVAETKTYCHEGACHVEKMYSGGNGDCDSGYGGLFRTSQDIPRHRSDHCSPKDSDTYTPSAVVGNSELSLHDGQPDWIRLHTGRGEEHIQRAIRSCDGCGDMAHISRRIHQVRRCIDRLRSNHARANIAFRDYRHIQPTDEQMLVGFQGAIGWRNPNDKTLGHCNSLHRNERQIAMSTDLRPATHGDVVEGALPFETGVHTLDSRTLPAQRLVPRLSIRIGFA